MLSSIVIVLGASVAVGGLLGALRKRRRAFGWGLAALCGAAGFALWAVAGAATEGPDSSFQTRIYYQVFLHGLVMLMVLGGAVSGAAGIVHERVHNTLESVRMTPLPASAFVDGKIAGCAWTLLPPACVLAALMAAGLLGGHLSVDGCALFLITAGSIVFVIALAGLRVSASSRKTASAIARTFALLVGYVWLVPMVLMLLLRGNAKFVVYINPIYWLAVSMNRESMSRDPLSASLAGLFVVWLCAFGVGWVLRRSTIARLEREREGA
jgi:ABC-type Na+ efflux pump permease subunit